MAYKFSHYHSDEQIFLLPSSIFLPNNDYFLLMLVSSLHTIRLRIMETTLHTDVHG